MSLVLRHERGVNLFLRVLRMEFWGNHSVFREGGGSCSFLLFEAKVVNAEVCLAVRLEDFLDKVFVVCNELHDLGFGLHGVVRETKHYAENCLPTDVSKLAKPSCMD